VQTTSTYSSPDLSPIYLSRWFKIALFNFLMAASFGVLLRYAFVNELKWLNYKSFQNAHSNLAILGWAYQSFYAFLLGAFVPSAISTVRKFNLLFWVNEFLILLITVSFAFTENKLIANILLCLFSLTSFYFIYHFLKATKSAGFKGISFRFAKLALYFLGISFIGIYIMLPALLISGTKKILLYYLSSHFFLHFQYNGWFTFSVLALFFKLCEDNTISMDLKKNISIMRAFFVALFLTFFLSLYWGDQSKLWLLWIASAGGLIQVLAIAYHWNYLRNTFFGLLANLDQRFKVIIIIACISFLLKLLMQTIIMVPFIASLAFTIRNYVIAYLHLIFIGMVSFFIFGWALEHRFVTIGRTVRIGIISFVAGFILVELILFVQGTMLWMGKGFISFYYPILFLISVLLPLGLLAITLRNLNYLRYNKSKYNES
jgi:hypothetical protein